MKFPLTEKAQALLLISSLVILALTLQWSSINFMNQASIKILLPLTSVDTIQENIINSCLTGNTPKVQTLKNQFIICQKIKFYYKELSRSYYINYYAFSICSIIFITLLTIAVFLVANKGWQNSPLIYRSFLLTTVVLSSIYYFLPNVLNNKANLEDNIAKVKIFQNIQSGIMQFSNIIDVNRKSQIDSAIAENYNLIAKNLDFLTTIDASKLDKNLEEIVGSLPGKGKK